MHFDHKAFDATDAEWTPPWASACADATAVPAMPCPRRLVEPVLLSKYPVFALGKKSPPTRTVKMSPTVTVNIESQCGAIATIYDYDILLYAISQVFTRNMVDLTARFRVADFLSVMNWDTGGSGYKRVYAALERLCHTRVTFIETIGDRQDITVIPLVADIEISGQKSGSHGALDIKLRLPEVLAVSAECSGGLVTLPRDYCLLKRPTDRALYRIALLDMTAGRMRKKKMTSWTTGELMTRLGSPQRSGPFKRDIKKVVDEWPLASLLLKLDGLDRGRETVLRAEFA